MKQCPFCGEVYERNHNCSENRPHEGLSSPQRQIVEVEWLRFLAGHPDLYQRSVHGLNLVDRKPRHVRSNRIDPLPA